MQHEQLIIRHQQLQDKLVEPSGKFAALETRLGELQRANKKSAEHCEELEAYLACVRQPEDFHAAQQLIAVLLRHGKPLPDDIHEHTLRLGLREKPHDMALTFSLVSLLLKQQRPLLPEPAACFQEEELAGEEESALQQLLEDAERFAGQGETGAAYAALWQAVIRFPRSARGYAEFARFLADRGDYGQAQVAIERALAMHPTTVESAAPLAYAMARLAENNRLAVATAEAWLKQASCLRNARVDAHNSMTARLLGKKDEALALAEHAVMKKPEDVEVNLAVAKAKYAAGDMAGSYAAVWQALQGDTPKVVGEIARTFGGPFYRLVLANNKADELAGWLSERAVDPQEISLVPPWPTPEAKLSAQRLRATALDRGLPVALLVTQPKSGSVAVGGILNHGFVLPTVLYEIASIRVVRSWAIDFMRGGACHVTHLVPSPTNPRLLAEAGARRIIVHVRDPRQQILSFMHHLQRYRADYTQPENETFDKMTPEALFEFAFGKFWFEEQRPGCRGGSRPQRRCRYTSRPTRNSCSIGISSSTAW